MFVELPRHHLGNLHHGRQELIFTSAGQLPRPFEIQHNLAVQGCKFFPGVGPWVRHNLIYVIQGFGDTDLEFLVEVVLLGGEVEAGHGGFPVFLVAESSR